MSFDKKSLDRIKRSVEYTERVTKTAPKKQPYPSVYPEPQIWAEITDLDEQGKYSWTMIEYDTDAEPDEFSQTEGITGDHTEDGGYAVEINGVTHALKGSRVLLWPLTYKPCLAFDYDSKAVFGVANGTISAKSGSVDGTGNVDVVVRDDTTQTVPVTNGYSSPVNSGVIVHIGIDHLGKWKVLGEDCVS